MPRYRMLWRVLRTQALDHETYIRRPDLGRKLTAESRLLLKENGKQQDDPIQLFVV